MGLYGCSHGTFQQQLPEPVVMFYEA